MLKTKLYIFAKIRTNVNLNLKRLIEFRKRLDSTLLSLMSKFDFHLAALMTVMNILTSRTKFPNICKIGTIMALNVNFILCFV